VGPYDSKKVMVPSFPDFFVIGAAKSGTTSLYHYLDQHPDVYMSPSRSRTGSRACPTSLRGARIR